MPSLQNDGIYQDRSSVMDLSGMSCLSNIHMSGLIYVGYYIVCYIVSDIVYDIVYDVLVLPVGFDPGNDVRRY